MIAEQLISEQFRTKEDAAAHSLRTGQAMYWEPGMENLPPVQKPPSSVGFETELVNTLGLITSAIDGEVQKLYRIDSQIALELEQQVERLQLLGLNLQKHFTDFGAS